MVLIGTAQHLFHTEQNWCHAMPCHTMRGVCFSLFAFHSTQPAIYAMWIELVRCGTGIGIGISVGVGVDSAAVDILFTRCQDALSTTSILKVVKLVENRENRNIFWTHMYVHCAWCGWLAEWNMQRKIFAIRRQPYVKCFIALKYTHNCIIHVCIWWWRPYHLANFDLSIMVDIPTTYTDRLSETWRVQSHLCVCLNSMRKW